MSRLNAARTDAACPSSAVACQNKTKLNPNQQLQDSDMETQITEEDLKNDARLAHAIFDLCGIKEKTHGGRWASLRLRAHLLAEMAGRVVTPEQAAEQMKNSKRDDFG